MGFDSRIVVGTMMLTIDGAPVANPHLLSEEEVEGKDVRLMIMTEDGWQAVA